MVRIAGKIYNGHINYIVGDDNADIEAVLPADLADEDIVAIKNADELEEVGLNHGEVTDVVGVYHLICWRSVTMGVNSIKFKWQTYRTTDISQIRQDNEDLTEAILELAAIIGGQNG